MALTPPARPTQAGTAAERPYITASGRDLRLDILRGYCVFAMIVDHIARSSPVYLVTGGNRFLVSAAEGFILISGLTAGVVYRRLIARNGLVAATRKALQRALTLYLIAVGLALTIAPISELFGLGWSQGLDFSDPLRFVVGVLTLHQTYYLADAMLLYTLLLAIMPLALLLLERGQARVLLLASGGLWLLHQLFPEQATVTWPVEGNYLFTFSAWQLLFFAGLTLGYHQDRLSAIRPARQRALHWLTGAGFALLIGLYFLLQQPANALPEFLARLRPYWDTLRTWIELHWFAKADLGPGRIMAATIVFTFLFLTLTRGWRWLGRPARMLLPLGQNALYAFTAHALLAVAVPLALISFGLPQDLAWLNAAIQVGAVLLITLMARSKFLGPSTRTRPLWDVVPLAMACAAIVVLPLLPFPERVAALAPVSDEVLARARAYGTPVSKLEAEMATSTALARRALAAGTPTPIPPTAGATAAVTPTPTGTPVTSTPGATVVAPTPTPAANRIPGANAAPSPTPTAEPTPMGLPTPEPLDVDPETDPNAFPPLPPDDQRVVSRYVPALAGSAYDRTFYSDILRRPMRYWVYLPPGYGESNRRYPTVYMLHGGGGDVEEWAAYGVLDAADLAFQQGQLQPFIIVLPQGDKSFWANWADDTPRWGDYLAYDVVWEIDSNFATLRTPRARAVAGNSMGGWGALYQGFTHPDVFGVAAAHSPSLYPDDGTLAFLGRGEDFASKDPLTLVHLVPPNTRLQLWLDIGDNDPWEPRALELRDSLVQRGMPHEYRTYPGLHGPEYWAIHLPHYLQFYASAFPRQ